MDHMTSEEMTRFANIHLAVQAALESVEGAPLRIRLFGQVVWGIQPFAGLKISHQGRDWEVLAAYLARKELIVDDGLGGCFLIEPDEHTTVAPGFNVAEYKDARPAVCGYKPPDVVEGLKNAAYREQELRARARRLDDSVELEAETVN